MVSSDNQPRIQQNTKSQQNRCDPACKFFYICRMVSRVAQPGECMSCAPSAVSLEVATRQRRESSSCGVGVGVSLLFYSKGKKGGKEGRAYLAQNVEAGDIGEQMEVGDGDDTLRLV
jgi:hypothetical protein